MLQHYAAALDLYKNFTSSSFPVIFLVPSVVDDPTTARTHPPSPTIVPLSSNLLRTEIGRFLMENINIKCPVCQGAHIEIRCPYRAKRDDLQRFYSEGYHNLAEVTANRLGLELNVSQKSLLERLTEPKEGREETPANLPPVGPWDPEFLEGRSASPDSTEGRVADHTTNPPTLLEDSDGTVSHGTAFEYWSRRLGFQDQSDTSVQEPSEDTGSIYDKGQTISSEDRFQNMISAYQSKTTAVAFPVDSRNISTVREVAASDGFCSVIIEPTSPAELPLIVIGRHAAALKQFTKPVLEARANRGFWASNFHKVLNIPYLVPFLGAAMAVAATWYYRRL